MCIRCSHMGIRMQSVLWNSNLPSHFLNILLAERELENGNTLPSHHKILACDDQSERRLMFYCLQFYFCFLHGFTPFLLSSAKVKCILMWCLKLAANPDVKWRNCSTQETACQHSVYGLSSKQCFYCSGRNVAEAIIQNNHWKCKKSHRWCQGFWYKTGLQITHTGRHGLTALFVLGSHKGSDWGGISVFTSKQKSGKPSSVTATPISLLTYVSSLRKKTQNNAKHRGGCLKRDSSSKKPNGGEKKAE